MIKSFNDIVRDFVYKTTPNDAVAKIRHQDEKYKTIIYKIILSDYYKQIIYEESGAGTFNKITNFESSISDLLALCDTSDKFLMDLIIKSSLFYNSSKVIKSIILDFVKLLSKEKFLMSLTKLHLLDKMVYSITPNLDSFKELYKEYKEKNDDVELQIALIYITDKIKSLEKLNKEKYDEILMECIELYYKYGIYFDGANANFNKELIQYISSSSKEVLLNFVSSNYIILNNIVEKYLYFSTTDLEMDKAKVDLNYKTNCSEELRKKFSK